MHVRESNNGTSTLSLVYSLPVRKETYQVEQLSFIVRIRSMSMALRRWWKYFNILLLITFIDDSEGK